MSVEIPILEKLDKKKLYSFKIVLENVPGMLTAVSAVFSKYNVNILSGIHTSQDRFSTWIFIADLSNSNVEVEKLIQEVKSLKGVTSAEARHETVGDLLINNFVESIKISGQEAMLIWWDMLKGIVGNTLRTWGDAGAVFLFHLGYQGAIALLSQHPLIAYGEAKERFIKALEFLRGLNWFKNFKVVEWTPMFNIVRVRVSKPCDEPFNWDRPPFTHLTRGIIAGLVAAITDRKVICEEVKSERLGDPYYEYLITLV